MSSSLDAFCEWARCFAVTLPASAMVEIQKLEDQAYIDIELEKGPLGRLSYWCSGSADAITYDASGNLVDFTLDPAWAGPWDNVSPENFEGTFAPFVRSFSTTEPI